MYYISGGLFYKYIQHTLVLLSKIFLLIEWINKITIFLDILEPVIQEETKVCDYCNLYINPTLLNGLTHVVKMKPVDPVMFLAEWLLLNNPFQPQFPADIAVTQT